MPSTRQEITVGGPVWCLQLRQIGRHCVLPTENPEWGGVCVSDSDVIRHQQLTGAATRSNCVHVGHGQWGVVGPHTGKV